MGQSIQHSTPQQQQILAAGPYMDPQSASKRQTALKKTTNWQFHKNDENWNVGRLGWFKASCKDCSEHTELVRQRFTGPGFGSRGHYFFRV